MIAMVTGASSGFGEAISRLLVSAGHRVIGTGRRAERLAALSEDLGEQFLPLVFDVQDKAATRAAIGIPVSMFTPIFALARTVGWISHWTEMISDPGMKIGRPRQLYTGSVRRDYAQVADRK